jgi:transposase-like protein
MSKNRRRFSDEFKENVVRRHLGDKVSVSDLAAEHLFQEFAGTDLCLTS